MKKSSCTIKLFAALVVAISPSIATATTSPDLTATGRVQLSRPGAISVPGVAGEASQVAFRAVVRENAGGVIPDFATQVVTIRSRATERIANRELIAAAGVTAPRGYTVVLVYEGNKSAAEPKLYAYNRRSGDIQEIPVNAASTAGVGLALGFDWLDFVGVYSAANNTATTPTTASPTAAPTPLKLASGRLNGFTGYTAVLDLGDGSIINMSGVGTFNQVPRGISGKANLSGIYTP
jgi:hypothetical protein